MPTAAYRIGHLRLIHRHAFRWPHNRRGRPHLQREVTKFNVTHCRGIFPSNNEQLLWAIKIIYAKMVSPHLQRLRQEAEAFQARFPLADKFRPK